MLICPGPTVVGSGRFVFTGLKRSADQIPAPGGGLTKKKLGHAQKLAVGYLTEWVIRISLNTEKTV